MIEWDKRFVNLAELIATWSKDTTKVGCIIVGPDREILSTGYNGLPRSVSATKIRMERPQKYQWIEHAERNAVYNAARNGVKLCGSIVYTNWFPCSDCARAIIQIGAVRLVGREPTYDHPKYGADFIVSRAMLLEAGIEISYIKETND